MNPIETVLEKNMEKMNVEFGKDQLINDFKVVVADAEALLKATANQGGEKLGEIRARAEESLRTVKASMAEMQDQLIEKSRAAAKATDAYVHENPWNAIGAAAGIGLLIGWLAGRR